ncbi:hypothetical protein [Massilia sp. Se16.2.3]|uniref:hypothetical protein n=1 Tax=Massilia sp. Se16.2.3 TaxID=2709303 RepID=UPI001E504B84|nr:hypothetical protein [Massilia sp. Se16.2.3]
MAQPAVPDGVAGWSWGAFLLNWIWAIGNRTWIGLLALVPYVGFGVAIWLGIKGREMAWKNGHWQSLEHFNRVQKSWSRWGVGLIVGILGLSILAAVAIPSYVAYKNRAQQAAAEVSLEDAIAANAEPAAPRHPPPRPPRLPRQRKSATAATSTATPIRCRRRWPPRPVHWSAAASSTSDA